MGTGANKIRQRVEKWLDKEQYDFSDTRMHSQNDEEQKTNFQMKRINVLLAGTKYVTVLINDLRFCKGQFQFARDSTEEGVKIANGSGYGGS